MIIKNIKVYGEDQTFKEGWVRIQNGIFSEVCRKESEDDSLYSPAPSVKDGGEIIDGGGCYAIPGLIDMHFHGCMGYDFCDGTKEAIEAIAKYQASVGVAAIAPATMTLPVKELEAILSTAAEYKKEPHPGAELAGINMEGPFISREKKGAQDERHIISCKKDICRRFLHASGGLVRFVGIAPESSSDALEFIHEMKEEVKISLAHTNADYDTAKAAFDAGACHAVHLYNAMPAFTHRAPGVIGAVSDSPHVNAEIICDGIHVHPSAVRAAFRMLGPDRMILISDSMRAAGMPDGRYTLGGLEVEVSGKRASLVSDGALAGSVTNLMDCMKTAVKEMGIPFETAVACASMNPARALGIYDIYGSITPGKKGFIVLLDESLEVKRVLGTGAFVQ